MLCGWWKNCAWRRAGPCSFIRPRAIYCTCLWLSLCTCLWLSLCTCLWLSLCTCLQPSRPCTILLILTHTNILACTAPVGVMWSTTCYPTIMTSPTLSSVTCISTALFIGTLKRIRNCAWCLTRVLGWVSFIIQRTRFIVKQIQCNCLKNRNLLNLCYSVKVYLYYRLIWNTPWKDCCKLLRQH